MSLGGFSVVHQLVQSNVGHYRSRRPGAGSAAPAQLGEPVAPVLGPAIRNAERRGCVEKSRRRHRFRARRQGAISHGIRALAHRGTNPQLAAPLPAHAEYAAVVIVGQITRLGRVRQCTYVVTTAKMRGKLEEHVA